MKTFVKAAISLGFAFVAASAASAQTTFGFYTETPQTYYPAVVQPRYIPPLVMEEQEAYVPQWRAENEWQARREWRERREQQMRQEQWRREREWRRNHWEHAERHRDNWQRDQWRRTHGDADDRD